MSDSPKDLYCKILGNAGERKVVALLKKQGLKILKRNWRTPFGEADVVAKEGEVVVFVEVKTRTTDGFSTPGAAVDGRKRKRYYDMARYFFACEGKECAVRFDVAEVDKNGINILKNAF